jgi:hypothetical protein
VTFPKVKRPSPSKYLGGLFPGEEYETESSTITGSQGFFE